MRALRAPPEPSGEVRVLSRYLKEGSMNNLFYIIGVVVVVLAVLGFFGFR